MLPMFHGLLLSLIGVVCLGFANPVVPQEGNTAANIFDRDDKQFPLEAGIGAHSGQIFHGSTFSPDPISPGSTQWNISITGIYGSCPGTKVGDTKMSCEWQKPTSTLWVDMTFESEEYSGQTINLPITLTTYSGTGEERSEVEIKWDVRSIPSCQQTQPDKFPHSREFWIKPWRPAGAERDRLRQAHKWADLEPTGFYLNPNRPLRVYCLTPSNEQTVQLVIGTPALVHPQRETYEMKNPLEETRPLENGWNTVSSRYGGIIYIRHTSASSGPGCPAYIRLEGDAGQPFPFYKEGLTADRDWKEMLSVTTVPFAEHSGRRIILTGLARHAKKYADKDQDQQELLDTFAEIIDAEDSFSDISANAPDPRDRPSQLRTMVVQTRSNVERNALNYRAAIPGKYDSSIWWEPTVHESWGIWHELGHQRQQSATWSWTALVEVTVNIYSLAVLHHYDPSANQKVRYWNAAKEYLAKPDDQKDYENGVFNKYDKFYIKLVMWEQLRVIFGDSFYHRLHYISRRTPEQKPQADKRHFFMVTASQISGYDLSDYFISWGLKPEQRSIDAMGRYPKPSEDYTKRPVFGGH